MNDHHHLTFFFLSIYLVSITTNPFHPLSQSTNITINSSLSIMFSYRRSPPATHPWRGKSLTFVAALLCFDCLITPLSSFCFHQHKDKQEQRNPTPHIAPPLEQLVVTTVVVSSNHQGHQWWVYDRDDDVVVLLMMRMQV